MSLRLTIHRGTKEIGGSCVELSCGPSHMIIDLGIPLVRPDGGEFDLHDHKGATGPELVNRGILPNVAGLYAWQEPSVVAVLISHGHLDHYGFLHHVHPSIPIYMSPGTRKLVEITTLFSGRGTPPGVVKTFTWPSTFTVGPFTITPHLVDHSAFGAFAFEITVCGRRVIYSGDFRSHGHIANATDIMLQKVTPGADVLLLEGTMFGREDDKVMTESDLAAAAVEICRRTEKAVLVYQSGQTVSRAVSFYKAAKLTGRLFIPDVYMAHVLTELGAEKGGSRLPVPGRHGFEDVRVWYPYWLTHRLFRDGLKNIPYEHCRHKVTRDEMAGDLGRVMLFVRPGMESDLARIDGLAGSILVYSLWGGYADKPRTRQFLATLEAMGVVVEHLHTSGHADRAALTRMVESLQPKLIVPIHTFHPEAYASQFSVPVQAVNDGEYFSL